MHPTNRNDIMPIPTRFFLLLLLLLSACAPTAEQIIPTERPTITATATVTPTSTDPVIREVTPTATITRPPASPTGGPSPTALLGPTRTPDAAVTATRVRSPNAPRIEFFTADVPAVAPGTDVTLFWSTRGADSATIYRLDPTGTRNQLWNVPPDGSLPVSTRLTDRGVIDFLISVGEGNDRIEQTLSLPLSCPVQWFFNPPPEECPDTEPIETRLIEQPMVRGRLLYIEDRDQVYALFNDGFDPAWVAFGNSYNPAIHEAFIEGFPVPPERYQPTAILGFVWRGSDIVRSRLGLGIQEAFTYEGFIQTTQIANGESLYVASSDRRVLQLLPEGDSWQIIDLP